MIHFVIVAVLTLVSTYGIKTYVLDNSKILPEAASLQAVPIDNLFDYQWWAMSFFFSLVVVFILYSLIVFGRKASDDANAAGEHFEGNTPLEIVWTLVPLGVVLLFAYLGSDALARVEARDPAPLEVNVIASQWNWRFEYPEAGITTNELVLPQGQQVLLKMYSEDVIHSFWVPEFRVKQDVLPGEEYMREMRITPTEVGEYTIRCAELCGQLHYDMLADVEVKSAPEFEGWLLEQAGGCEDDPAVCGQKWATQFGCLACHSVDGTQIVGPTWLGLFGSQVPLADGSSVVGDADYMFESIVDPNAKIHEGFLENVMPANFADTLTEDQINQIIAFIESLGQ